MKKLSMFKPEHLTGDYKYDIFDVIGTNAYGTDFCVSFNPHRVSKGSYAEGQIPVRYWMDWSDYGVDTDHTLSSWSYHSCVNQKGNFDKIVYYDHHDVEEESKNDAGIRIVLPLSEFPLENVTSVNGFETAEYGEYPQTEASSDIATELEKLRVEKKLVRTGKKYTVSMYKNKIEKAEEFIYEGKKYIYCNEKYYEVKPITWVISREDKIAFSREVLTSNIPVNRLEEFLTYDMSREILPLEQYLEHELELGINRVELEKKINKNVKRQREAFISKVNEANLRILTTRDLLLLDKAPIPEKEYSDFAALLGLGLSGYEKTVGSWIDSGDNEDETILRSDGKTLHSERQSMAKNAGVRPVLVINDIKDIEIKNGSFEYGEYPQTLVKNATLISKLDEAYSRNKLNKTGKVYTINTADNRSSYAKSSESHFDPVSLDEFEYDEKKYVRIVTNDKGRLQTSDGSKPEAGCAYYVEVEPIKWNVIKDGELAIANQSLFTNINLNHIQSYLNTFFANEMMLDNYRNTSQVDLEEIRFTPYRLNIKFETPEKPMSINHLYADMEKKNEAQREFFIKDQTNSILRYYKEMLLRDYNEKKAKEIFEKNSKEVVKLLLKDALEGDKWWLDNVNYEKTMRKQMELPIRVISKQRIKTFIGLIKKDNKDLAKEQKSTIKKLI